jgi:hypothetical protein
MMYKKAGLELCVLKAKAVNMNHMWVEYVLSVEVCVAQLSVEMQVFQVTVVSYNFFFPPYILNLDM